MTALEKLIAGGTPDAHPAPAGSIDAPELGPNERVYIRRLSVGDLMRFDAIQKDKDAPQADRLARLLPLCLCRPDGSPLAPPDAAPDAFRAVPMAVALRAVKAAAELNTGGADDAKKPSPPTGN